MLTYAEDSLLKRLAYLKITKGLTPAQEGDLTFLLRKKDDDAQHRKHQAKEARGRSRKKDVGRH